MAKKVVPFRSDSRFVRRARELRTFAKMASLYCRHHHGGKPLCPDCTEVARYSMRRLERCVFGDAKPTCANCVVHCYRKDMREAVREIMRWAGPRMLPRHPVLAILHMIDGWRPAIRLPAAQAKSGKLDPNLCQRNSP